MLKRRVLAERAIVPDYLDQMRIQLLENHNSKLLTDISNLQGEIHTLKQEVSKLSGENPDYIRSLKERVKEYEKREIELKEKILLIAKESKSSEEELANLNPEQSYYAGT
jgi:chromosome segregation ATPase